MLVADGDQEIIAGEKAKAENYPARKSKGLVDAGLEVRTQVSEGWPVDMILEAGETLGPGLIVMTTHGDTGQEEPVMGRVPREIVQRGLWPVLLVRPQPQIAIELGWAVRDTTPS